MIKYDKQSKTLSMDLMDLEHCGFDHDDFSGELSGHGIDDKDAEWPDVLLVNFAGGHVIFGKPSEEDANRIREQGAKFKRIVDAAEKIR